MRGVTCRLLPLARPQFRPWVELLEDRVPVSEGVGPFLTVHALATLSEAVQPIEIASPPPAYAA